MPILGQAPRKSKRLKARDCIASTPAGFCQIININSEGLSFKCVKEWSFSQELSLDLYDTAGLNLEQLQVKKIWEKYSSNLCVPLQFSTIVGVAFNNLSDLQKAQLNSYIRRLEGLLD